MAQKFDEGKAEGIAEGKVEDQMHITRNLLSLSVEIRLIVKATGLNETQIQSLQS